jgi:hypothetical protein
VTVSKAYDTVDEAVESFETGPPAETEAEA